MKLLATILVAATMFIANNLSAQNSNITATVLNATSDSGKVSYALYTKDNFRMDPIQAESSKIINGKSTVTFKNVPAGEYAIVCFHDKNDNDKLDFDEYGRPIEDYGVSNNVINRFGPPKYDDAKFAVADKNVTLNIKF